MWCHLEFEFGMVEGQTVNSNWLQKALFSLFFCPASFSVSLNRVLRLFEASDGCESNEGVKITKRRGHGQVGDGVVSRLSCGQKQTKDRCKKISSGENRLLKNLVYKIQSKLNNHFTSKNTHFWRTIIITTIIITTSKLSFWETMISSNKKISKHQIDATKANEMSIIVAACHSDEIGSTTAKFDIFRGNHYFGTDQSYFKHGN